MKSTKYVFEVITGYKFKARTDGSLKKEDFTVIAATAMEACQKVLEIITPTAKDVIFHDIISVERKVKIDA